MKIDKTLKEQLLIGFRTDKNVCSTMIVGQTFLSDIILNLLELFFISDPRHQVSQAMFRMEAVEEVRIIEKKKFE